MDAQVDSRQIANFLIMVRSIENNDFADRAVASCRLIHSTLGITTEVMELKQLIDRYSMDYAHDACPSEAALLDFRDEVGDIVFYLLQGMDIFHWNYDNLETPAGILKINTKNPMDGLLISVGEINDVLKKYLAYNTPVYLCLLRSWYSEIWRFLLEIVREYGVTFQSCLRVTKAKLDYRYATGKFRYEDRANRSREEERKVMKEAANE